MRGIYEKRGKKAIKKVICKYIHHCLFHYTNRSNIKNISDTLW